MVASTTTAKPNYCRQKYCRRGGAATTIHTLWWFALLLMVSSCLPRKLVCSGWTLPSCKPRKHYSKSFLEWSTTTAVWKMQNRWSPLVASRIGFCRTSWISSVSSSSSSTSTTLFMVKAKTTHKWEVGDLVQILPKNATSESQKGEIVSIRGSGWYSVRLLPQNSNDKSNSSELIKCRGTRLERLAFDIRDGKALANATKPRSPLSPKAALPLRDETTQQQTPIEAYHTESDRDEFPQAISIHDLDAFCFSESNNVATSNTGGRVSSRMEDELRKQVAHHATFEHWVAFTDLHCSPSTLDTCLEVLDRVHQTAVEHPQKCGVLFLGDFWHHRGTLKVDCLNAILGALSKWTVPMIMIPGNHDQVTLGGDNHGLTPLANAYRISSVAGPLILSQPTLFRKALFVPHIRHQDAFRAVVSSPQAQTASALFLHAEVKGARMNDQMVSTHGISPSVFPSHQQIYSGHFHKPHVVETKQQTIQYLGSPYQVSLAEAHQEKQLLILDKDWKCQNKVPISVGRQHFKLSSVEDLQKIRVMEHEEQPTPLTKDSICVKKGDRIVVTAHPDKLKSETNGNDAPWKSHVQSLRERGFMVEIREASDDQHPINTKESKSNIPGVEELSPESVWRAYLDTFCDSIHTDEECKALLKTGLEILEEIQDSSLSPQNRAAQRDLKLTSLSVAGFGPFQDTVDYPLDNRGLVLLRGSNSDSGPDSNGTGKSSLAMATLWALTGSLDARPASDLKVADVVNDNSKIAKVTVRGYINDSPFVVTRTKATSRGGDLMFAVNDEDLTTQSVKETQAVLEERLGVNTHILTRVAFYGQHGMNDLLEATDSKLKEELSMIVPLELWQQATSTARAKSRQARKKVDEIGGMVRLRKSDIDALSIKVARAKQNRDFKQRGLIEAKDRLNRELARIQNLLDQTSSTNVEELQMQLDDASKNIQILNDHHSANMRERESHLKPFEEKLIEARDALTLVSRESTRLEMDERSAKQTLDSAKMRMARIQKKWSLDASREIPSVLKPPEYCPTCQQPLRSEEPGEVEHFQNAQMIMEKEIREAQETLALAKAACIEASAKSSECLETLHTHETNFRDLQSNHQKAASEWNSKFQELQDQLIEKRRLQNTLTSQLSMVVKESQLFAAKESAKAAFHAEELNASHADEVYKELQKELETAQDFLETIREEQKQEENRQVLLSSVGERFGQKGVQTFLLQNTVDSLQSTTQIYLSRLSEDSQRLELSLDAGDKILRSAFVRGADGEFRQRPLSTLSGGQWRRCSLALSLAFADLVASQGRLRSSLLVLDEPLTHLDRSGRARFGELVRGLLGNTQELPTFISTAIVILQDLSAEELEESFDGIDTVVRKDGTSRLILDDMASKPEP